MLKVARMDPESAVIRCGNFDWTLALSSAVFERDDHGRSYRLLPDTRSVWLVGLSLYNAPTMFEIPDTAEARAAGIAAGGTVVPRSVQHTNSWGCRGPEPDRNAPLRGLVLGDSLMQGLLVGDDQTPPMCLQRALQESMGVPVSILNTGHLGYSPEQYFYTLQEYFERFEPHFVVISICGNDFGDMSKPANWAETKYWLDRISQFCRAHEALYLLVPMPGNDMLLGHRNLSVFPGQVSRIYQSGGMRYFDPLEGFTNEDLRLINKSLREGRPTNHAPLYNLEFNDHHLSPEGCALWGRLVGERLTLILKEERLLDQLYADSTHDSG